MSATNFHPFFVGGEPAPGRPLLVGRPNLPHRERFLDRVNDLLDRAWLTNNGPFVQEFEARVAALVGARNCVAVANGTLAIEIAARALELTGEVICPAFTFVATAHALKWCGLSPVFCDVDPKTYCLDPAKAERLVTPRTSALIGVHVWGTPCDTEAVGELADAYGLRVLYDAAHAFGCSSAGRMIGTFGDAETFSFHATKFVNAIEGGAIVTDDDELAERARLMRSFGMASPESIVALGTNAKLNEVSAAMGLCSLEAMEEIIEANRRNYRCYREALADLRGITVLPHDDRERHNYQYVVLLVEAAWAGLGRDDLLAELKQANVHARPYFSPGCHEAQPYRLDLTAIRAPLPVTERVASQALCLPTGLAVSPADIRRVAQVIRNAVRAARPAALLRAAYAT
jgi:dTDP-4-amino-4,6-dideoxygalactose transaminase